MITESTELHEIQLFYSYRNWVKESSLDTGLKWGGGRGRTKDRSAPVRANITHLQRRGFAINDIFVSAHGGDQAIHFTETVICTNFSVLLRETDLPVSPVAEATESALKL